MFTKKLFLSIISIFLFVGIVVLSSPARANWVDDAMIHEYGPCTNLSEAYFTIEAAQSNIKKHKRFHARRNIRNAMKAVAQAKLYLLMLAAAASDITVDLSATMGVDLLPFSGLDLFPLSGINPFPLTGLDLLPLGIGENLITRNINAPDVGGVQVPPSIKPWEWAVTPTEGELKTDTEIVTKLPGIGVDLPVDVDMPIDIKMPIDAKMPFVGTIALQNPKKIISTEILLSAVEVCLLNALKDSLFLMYDAKNDIKRAKYMVGMMLDKMECPYVEPVEPELEVE